MKGARNSRRAILILSDGGDNDSRYTESELRKRVRESDVWVYAMGIMDSTRRFCRRKWAPGRVCSRPWRRQSGGRHYAVEEVGDLPAIAGQIRSELRNQYLLGYRPSDPRRDGKYHRLQVKVAAGRRLTVSWRPGYFGTAQ